MFDLQIQEFTERILKEINSCGLPITVIGFVIQDVLDGVNEVKKNTIATQRKKKEENEARAQKEIEAQTIIAEEVKPAI